MRIAKLCLRKARRLSRGWAPKNASSNEDWRDKDKDSDWELVIEYVSDCVRESDSEW